MSRHHFEPCYHRSVAVQASPSNNKPMCLQTSAVTPWHDWNWGGDEIVYEPIIAACELHRILGAMPLYAQRIQRAR
jgi:hypothetical protein